MEGGSAADHAAGTADYIKVEGSGWQLDDANELKSVDTFSRPLTVQVEMQQWNHHYQNPCIGIQWAAAEDCNHPKCGYGTLMTDRLDINLPGNCGTPCTYGTPPGPGCIPGYCTEFIPRPNYPGYGSTWTALNRSAWHTVKMHFSSDGNNEFFHNGILLATKVDSQRSSGHLVIKGCTAAKFRNLEIWKTPPTAAPTPAPTAPTATPTLAPLPLHSGGAPPRWSFEEQRSSVNPFGTNRGAREMLDVGNNAAPFCFFSNRLNEVECFVGAAVCRWNLSGGKHSLACAGCRMAKSGSSRTQYAAAVWK